MKTCLLPVAMVLIGAWCLPVAAQDPAAVVVQRYNEVESNLGSYRLKQVTERGDMGEVERKLWTDPAGVYHKMSERSYGDHGVTITEVYLRNGRLFFAFQRTEQTPMMANAATRVREDRHYYAGGQLVRHLSKQGSAKLRDNQILDLSGVRNTTESIDPGDDTFATFSEQALNLAQELGVRIGTAPEPPPRPDNGGGRGRNGLPSGPWRDYARLIEGTTSPTGRYALGWGFPHRVNWAEFRQDDGSYMADTTDEGLSTYLIDLKNNRITARIEVPHWGDSLDLRGSRWEILWAKADIYFVIASSGKWETNSCWMYAMVGESDAPVASLDMLPGAVRAITRAVEGRGEDASRFVPTIEKFRFSSWADVTFEVFGQVPKDDGYVRLRLKGTIGITGSKIVIADVQQTVIE